MPILTTATEFNYPYEAHLVDSHTSLISIDFPSCGDNRHMCLITSKYGIVALVV